MKTLVVEDDLMSQCLLAKVLAERGHEVVSYENAEQAILAYQKQFYPLLFVDVGLPGMDGLQFCKWVRSQPNGDKVFVMVAASSGQPADLSDVLNVGANDFLSKPYDVGALNVRLTIAERQMKEFFGRKELEENLRESHESFQRLVKAANEGAWLLSAQFRTEYANPQMAEMLGYQAEELANRAVVDFLAEPDQSDAESLFSRLNNGEEIRTGFRLRRKDASECCVLLSATPVMEAGEFKGSLWMVSDLSGQKDLETKLDETRRELEQQIQTVSAQLEQANQTVQTEANERARVEQSLQQTRAEIEAALREHEGRSMRLAEELKAETARTQETRAQLVQVREELTARTQQLSAELDRARESLQSASARHKEAESEFAKVRKELEGRNHDQAGQLTQAERSLQAEMAERKKIAEELRKIQHELETRSRHFGDEQARAEKALQTQVTEKERVAEALQKVRHDLEAETRRHSDELGRVNQLLQTESAERKKNAEALQKVQHDLETRGRQFAEEAARAERALQAEQGERKRVAELLQKSQHERETLVRRHAEELAKTERSLQSEMTERKRAAEAAQKTQHDLETRVKELKEELAAAQGESRKESAERKRTEQELGKLRDELNRQARENAADLQKAKQELKAELSERKRVEEELLKTREDLARRVKEHMAEMVKASEELKASLAERKRVEAALTQEREAVELKVSERSNELGRVRDQLKAETAERTRLEQAQLKLREDLESRLKQREAELAEAGEELKQRVADLTRTGDALKSESTARRRVEEALQNTEAQLGAKIEELSHQLNGAKQAAQDRAAHLAQVQEELKAATGGLSKLEEDLAKKTEAQQQAEARRETFARLGRELTAAHSAIDAARVTVGVAQELVGWDACSVDLFLPEQNRILPVLNIDIVNGRPADVPPAYAGPEPSPIMQRVMKDGPQLILRSGPSSSHTDYILFGDRARLSASLMYVAIRAGENVVGFLSVHSYSPNAYDPSALEALGALADYCGGALERIRAGESRQHSDERFQLIARATSDVVRDWNLENDQVWWNEAFQSVFGWGTEQIEPGSESWKDRIHVEDRERVLAGMNAFIGQGVQSWAEEYRFRRHDGTYAHVLDRGHVIRDDEGRPVRLIGAMTDISQRKHAEEAMIENQARKGAILEMALDCIITVDHEGRVFEWNPAAERTFGYRRAEVLGKALAELIIPAAQRDQYREGLARYIETGEGFVVGKRVELAAVRADGHEFPVEMEVTRISKEGPPILTAFVRDITERKRAEMEIQKLAAFPRLNPNPILELAADGTLTYFNDAAKEMALSLGKDHPSAILPDDIPNIVRECLSKGQNRLRLETVIAGRTISWSFFPIISNNAVHCYAADMTERLSLESQLRQAQKMESIGQLAAGVAHDFNNLLSIVQGYSTLLIEEKDLKPEMAEALKQIASATERATHLTRQLLTFSRKQLLNIRTLDLNEVINNVSKLLRRVTGESIALQFNYSPNLPPVEADTGMMEQVVMNLAINARDAMPQGGQLLIGTKVVDVDEAYAAHNPESRTGRFVCFSVTDTGSGMDEATLGRIFEPFFTTKPSGKGTGLGLATVYGIVKQHRGWIDVQSQAGRGTTFKIFLPVSSKAAPATDDRLVKPVVRGGTETILLVEDEPAVLMMAKGILQRQGYRVFEASSGDNAVPVWQQHSAQVDLLLTDMVMPGSLNGRELAEKLRADKPSLKVIYTSGYSMELLGGGLTSSKDFVFLQKPYHPENLALLVRSCLDGKAG